MMPTILTRLLSALTTKEGAVIAAPLVAGLAAIATLGSSPAPATQPLVLAQAAAPAPSTEASSFSAAQRAEIERIVKDYLISHPEVMIEVSKELEKSQSTLQAESPGRSYSSARHRSSGADAIVVGNTKGEITVVEFFDYNCGWCKKAIDEVQKLAKADPQVRIVIARSCRFSCKNSGTAARVAMASIKQGKYWEFASRADAGRSRSPRTTGSRSPRSSASTSISSRPTWPTTRSRRREGDRATSPRSSGIEGTPAFPGWGPGHCRRASNLSSVVPAT